MAQTKTALKTTNAFSKLKFVPKVKKLIEKKNNENQFDCESVGDGWCKNMRSGSIKWIRLFTQLNK